MSSGEFLPQLMEVLKTLNITRGQELDEGTQVSGLYLTPFDEHNEKFDTYIQRLENYFNLKNINDEKFNKKKIEILLNSLNPSTYQMLTKLTAPYKPNSKSFKELIILLMKYYDPICNEIAEQYRFFCRIQNRYESINGYASDLKKLSIKCNFNCNNCQTSIVDTLLRAQFIKGIRDNDIRTSLLKVNKKCNFKEVLEIALTMETTKMNNNQTDGEHMRKKLFERSELYYNPERTVKKNKMSLLEGCCYRCGGDNHRANKCKYIRFFCRYCKKMGHIERVCLKKRFNEGMNINNKYGGDTSSENGSTISSNNHLRELDEPTLNKGTNLLCKSN